MPFAVRAQDAWAKCYEGSNYMYKFRKKYKIRAKLPCEEPTMDFSYGQAGWERASADTREQAWTHSHIQACSPLTDLPTQRCRVPSFMWSASACPGPVCPVSSAALMRTEVVGACPAELSFLTQLQALPVWDSGLTQQWERGDSCVMSHRPRGWPLTPR